MDGNPMLQLLNPKISTETAISVLFSFHFLYCSLFLLFSQGNFYCFYKNPPYALHKGDQLFSGFLIFHTSRKVSAHQCQSAIPYDSVDDSNDQ